MTLPMIALWLVYRAIIQWTVADTRREEIVGFWVFAFRF